MHSLNKTRIDILKYESKQLFAYKKPFNNFLASIGENRLTKLCLCCLFASPGSIHNLLPFLVSSIWPSAYSKILLNVTICSCLEGGLSFLLLLSTSCFLIAAPALPSKFFSFFFPLVIVEIDHQARAG